MKITVIQHDIQWNDVAANLAHIGQLLSDAPKSDVYVLTEMFATGFCMKPEKIAQKPDGSIVTTMKGWAQRLDAAVCGSVATEEDGKYYNRLYFVMPDGKVEHYDKRHLFTYSGEHERYAGGKERKIVEFRGVRFLLQVCYDLRFPVWSRNRGDYDTAIYVASWPVSRIQVWDLLLKARSLENQCYVVGANRVGSDPLCEYSGNSVIVDSYGRVIAESDTEGETYITADLDMEKLQSFRSKFSVLNDADDYEIRL